MLCNLQVQLWKGRLWRRIYWGVWQTFWRKVQGTHEGSITSRTNKQNSSITSRTNKQNRFNNIQNLLT